MPKDKIIKTEVAKKPRTYRPMQGPPKRALTWNKEKLWLLRADALFVNDVQTHFGFGILRIIKDTFNMQAVEVAEDASDEDKQAAAERFIIDAPMDSVYLLAYLLTASQRLKEEEDAEDAGKAHRPVSLRRFIADLNAHTMERQTQLLGMVFALLNECITGLEEEPDSGNAAPPAEAPGESQQETTAG